MEQNDRVYYLKDLELALFLSLKGMDELFGFKMKGILNPDPKQVYQAIFELKKKDLLTVQSAPDNEKEKIVISPELDQILDTIRYAENVLFYFNRQSEVPDQCIYLGNMAVFISEYGTTGNIYRIESVTTASLPEAIIAHGFCIEELLHDKSIYDENEIKLDIMQEKADLLFAKDFSTLDDQEWGTVTDCLRQISIGSRECIKQYFLVKDGLNDYLAVSDKNGSRIYRYSRKKVLDTLKTDILK